METDKNYFRLDGLTGYFIAVALLLSILGFLIFNAIIVQAREATNPYTITDSLKIKKIDVNNANLRVVN
jgi:hypothetical protein